MDDLAQWLLQEQYFRREDGRGRPRKGMGADLRKRLFVGLETGAWIDVLSYQAPRKQKLYSYSLNHHTDGDPYTGAFVEYVKAYCFALAQYVERQKPTHPAFTGLANNLRRISKRGEHVRDGLAMSGMRRKFLTLASE
jgi:hypothetical protein